MKYKNKTKTSGTHWTIIKDLIHLSSDSWKKRERIGLKNT